MPRAYGGLNLCSNDIHKTRLCLITRIFHFEIENMYLVITKKHCIIIHHSTSPRHSHTTQTTIKTGMVWSRACGVNQCPNSIPLLQQSWSLWHTPYTNSRGPCCIPPAPTVVVLVAYPLHQQSWSLLHIPCAPPAPTVVVLVAYPVDMLCFDIKYQILASV